MHEVMLIKQGSIHSYVAPLSCASDLDLSDLGRRPAAAIEAYRPPSFGGAGAAEASGSSTSSATAQHPPSYTNKTTKQTIMAKLAQRLKQKLVILSKDDIQDALEGIYIPELSHKLGPWPSHDKPVSVITAAGTAHLPVKSTPRHPSGRPLYTRRVAILEHERLPDSGPVDVPNDYWGYAVGHAIIGTCLPQRVGEEQTSTHGTVQN